MHLEIGGFASTHSAVNDRVLDIGAAYDPDGEWLGVAAGIMHDEGIGRGPTPHVFFYGLATDSRSVEIIVAGPLLASEPADTPVRPAIMSTGDPRASFLVAWASADGDFGRIDGVRVHCP